MKRQIVPEFVQKEFNVNSVFRKSCKLLEKNDEKLKMKQGYKLLKNNLGDEGVTKRAAKEIINSII